MNAKHQFKYSYSETDLEEFSPVDITMEVPGEVTLTQMLWNFECYLKACGFVFDGKLDFVEEGYNLKDELDGTLYEFEDEPQGGCMAGFDKECGCEATSSPLESENSKWNKWNEAEKKIKEWNEGIAKLDNEQRKKDYEQNRKMSDLHYEATKEVVKNKWVHGLCNPPSPDWKKSS